MILLLARWFLFHKLQLVIIHWSLLNPNHRTKNFSSYSAYLDRHSHNMYYIVVWFFLIPIRDSSKEERIVCQRKIDSSHTWLISEMWLNNSVHNWVNFACRFVATRSVTFPIFVCFDSAIRKQNYLLPLSIDRSTTNHIPHHREDWILHVSNHLILVLVHFLVVFVHHEI